MPISHGLMAIKRNPDDEAKGNALAYCGEGVPEGLGPDACFKDVGCGPEPFAVLHFVGYWGCPSQESREDFAVELHENEEFAYASRAYDEIVDAPQPVVDFFAAVIGDDEDQKTDDAAVDNG